MLVDMSVDEGVEYELGILFVITYLPLITQPLSLLCQIQTDGVDASAVVVQRVEIAAAVDTRGGRCVHVDKQFLEIDVLPTLQ